MKVHFGCDGQRLDDPCSRGGRFDFTVQPLSYAVGNHAATYSFESAFVTGAGIAFDDAGLFLTST